MSEPIHAGADHRHQVHLADVPGFVTASAQVDSYGRTLVFVDASSSSANGPDFDGTNHDRAANYLLHRGERYSALLHFQQVGADWLPLAVVYDGGPAVSKPVALDSSEAREMLHRPLKVYGRPPKTYAVKMLTAVSDAIAKWAASDAGRLAIAQARMIAARETKAEAWALVDKLTADLDAAKERAIEVSRHCAEAVRAYEQGSDIDV